MPKRLCPYLGLKDDPQTALEFPADGNYCYHARPVESVQFNHQRDFCLGANHRACPVFLRANLDPLPAKIAARGEKEPFFSPAVRLLAIASAFAIILTLLFFFGRWDRALARLGILASGSGGIPVTGLLAESPTPFMPGLAYTPTGEPGLLFQFTSSPNPTFAACPQPDGWQIYVAKPTDSLVLLSVLYNVPLDVLQAANCLSDPTSVQPGDYLYLPPVPTPTPSLTPTNTPAPVLPAVIFPSNPPPAQPSAPEPSNPPPPQPTVTSQPEPTGEPKPTQPEPQKPTDPPKPTDEPKPTDGPKPTKEPKPTHAPKPTKSDGGDDDGDDDKDDDDKDDISPFLFGDFFLLTPTVRPDDYNPLPTEPDSGSPDDFDALIVQLLEPFQSIFGPPGP